MAKVDFNALLNGVRGPVQGLLFRKFGDQPVVSPMPDPRRSAPSEAELRGRENISAATWYAKRLPAELKERYLAVARLRHHPLRAVINKDFANPPIIEAIDVEHYHGQAGQVIRIHARDDFEVRAVTVRIQNASSADLEVGAAVHVDGDEWRYTTTTLAGTEGEVSVEVTVVDWPGHPTIQRVSRNLSPQPTATPITPRAALAGKLHAAVHVAGEFKLRAGGTTRHYYDLYRLASSPGLLRAIAEEMAPLLPKDFDFLAGLELGGLPLALTLAQITGKPAVFIRRQPPSHGTGRTFEGAEIVGRRLVLIDDIVATGAQLVASARLLRESGAIVAHAVCAIDRQSGAGKTLERENLALATLFTSSELRAAAEAGV